MGRPGRRTTALLVLAALPPTIEAALLVGLRLPAAEGLAPQASAVFPYDSYHDLRWLLVYHNSWFGFGSEFVLALLFRAVLTTALIGLAWPPDTRPRPSWRWLFGRSLQIAVLAALIISPWAALSVAAAGVALSWYLLASLVPLLLLAPFLQRAGVVRDWWRGLPSWELTGWTTLNFATLTLIGAVTSSVLNWWTVPMATVAGLVNGLLWQRTVRAALRPVRIRWRRVPVALIAVLLALASPLVAESVIGIAAGGQRQWRPPVLREDLPGTVDHAVIVLGGYASRYDGQPAGDPLVERFSYRGLDGRGRPRPYPPEATQQSLTDSARLLSAQVDAVHRRTRLPVALVGQSEGAMVARTFLELRPRSPVDTVLLFSPLVRAGRTYYPPPEEKQGWGLAAGWGLRGIFAVTNLTQKEKDHPDVPFVRSILDGAPFYRSQTLCPVPGVLMVAFLPTVSAAEAPPGEYAKIPVYQAPAFHGGLIGRSAAQRRLVKVLEGAVNDERRREYAPLQRFAAAWQAPPLALSVNPVWRAGSERVVDPARTGRVCRTR
ncbi:hypothetical protein [Micromonospora cathayae]|uniref:Alpha/beta hydrolase family protein n=1 Tax=Micromonospora cathayae TaxID=3028804 RepID=A0ABY8A0Z9_9ACTN|nr:hypothetical protein [Micromonospora sp. HUAS 3]WDZ87669.1 hypothetical protein PVK37_15290 [Micromonospora sp. HUAS 3]